MDGGSPLCAHPPSSKPPLHAQLLSLLLSVYLGLLGCVTLVITVSRRKNLIDPGSGKVNTLDPVHPGQVFTTADWRAGPKKQQWK